MTGALRIAPRPPIREEEYSSMDPLLIRTLFITPNLLPGSPGRIMVLALLEDVAESGVASDPAVLTVSAVDDESGVRNGCP